MSARQVLITRRIKWKFDAKDFLEDTVNGVTGVIPLLTFEANSLVMSVKAYVKSAVTGSTAETVGDGTDVDGYLVDGFAAATGFFPKTYAAASAATEFFGAYAAQGDSMEAKFYNAGDSVDLVLTGTATAGELDFYIDYMVLE